MSSSIHMSYYKTKIGELIIASFEGKICIVDFRYRKMRTTVDNRIKRGLKAQFVEREDEVIAKTKKQIDEYLKGERRQFSVPILTVGTPFQRAVWSALLEIPYGKTASYLDVAKRIAKARAVRAVAAANGANSIALIIPCHRIIESGGGIGGYGAGSAVKKRLLKLESDNC